MKPRTNTPTKKDITSLLDKITGPQEVDVQPADENAPIIRLVSLIILEAYRQHTRKVEICYGKFVRLLYDGRDAAPFPKYLYRSVHQAIRTMAGIPEGGTAGTIDMSLPDPHPKFTIGVTDKGYDKGLEMTLNEAERA